MNIYVILIFLQTVLTYYNDNTIRFYWIFSYYTYHTFQIRSSWFVPTNISSHFVRIIKNQKYHTSRSMEHKYYIIIIIYCYLLHKKHSILLNLVIIIISNLEFVFKAISCSDERNSNLIFLLWLLDIYFVY